MRVLTLFAIVASLVLVCGFEDHTTYEYEYVAQVMHYGEHVHENTLTVPPGAKVQLRLVTIPRESDPDSQVIYPSPESEEGLPDAHRVGLALAPEPHRGTLELGPENFREHYKDVLTYFTAIEPVHVGKGLLTFVADITLPMDLVPGQTYTLNTQIVREHDGDRWAQLVEVVQVEAEGFKGEMVIPVEDPIIRWNFVIADTAQPSSTGHGVVAGLPMTIALVAPLLSMDRSLGGGFRSQEVFAAYPLYDRPDIRPSTIVGWFYCLPTNLFQARLWVQKGTTAQDLPLLANDYCSEGVLGDVEAAVDEICTTSDLHAPVKLTVTRYKRAGAALLHSNDTSYWVTCESRSSK